VAESGLKRSYIFWLRQSYPGIRKSLDNFLESLAYPAVAGNIAWAVTALAVGQDTNASSLPRVLVLLALAIYVFAEVYQTKKIASERCTYCVISWWQPIDLLFDVVFVAGVIFFAIATEMGQDLSNIVLFILLGIAGFGHWFELWNLPKKNEGSAAFGLSCIIAAFLAILLMALSDPLKPWLVFGLVFVEVCLWFNFRRLKRL